MADNNSTPHDLPTEPHGEKPHEEPHKETPADGERSLFSSVIAIVGFIILIVILIWGLVHLISLGGNWVTSLSGKPGATIQVSAPGSATSGEPFTVTWKYTPSKQGTYAFLYPCAPTLKFEAIGPQNSVAQIPCGQPFTMPVTNNSLTLTPTLSATSSIVTPLSIIFLPNATGTAMTTGQAQGSTTITINPATSTEPTSTKSSKPSSATGKSTTYHAKTYANSGPADLAVSSVSGSVDGQGNATVTFDIGNIGGSPTGTYYFTANLPVAAGAYTSPMQSSLNPGDHIVNTLRFGPVSGSGIFSVTIIPGGADLNSANNSSTFMLTGGTYPGTYNYNNGYPTQNTNYNYNIGGAYYPNTYPYNPQPCYTSTPCQNQPLYYTNGSRPMYTSPYNQTQPYYYQTY